MNSSAPNTKQSQKSQKSPKSRPCDIKYDEMNEMNNAISDYIDEIRNENTQMHDGESPHIRCVSPMSSIPNAEKGSPTYYKSGTPQTPDGSPPYTSYIPTAYYNDNIDAHLPTYSPLQEPKITIAEAIYIPRWSIGFVLGGRSNKHLNNILNRYGNLIEIVGEPV
jgi:hypothetical protein